jgi:adenylate cyclase
MLERVSKPLVAVFPLRAAMEREGANEFSLLLKEQLSEELLKFHDISVIGYYSDAVNAKLQHNILEAGKLAGAHYIITGSLSYIRGHLRVLINLLATETGEVMYCKSFETNIVSGEPFEINDEIAQNCNAFAAECYGMILGVQKHIA